MPSPPSTPPSDARGRRSFAFAREDSGTANGSALLVNHRRLWTVAIVSTAFRLCNLADLARQNWQMHRVFLIVPAQAVVARYIESFKEFLPRAKAASFTVSDVMEKIQRRRPLMTQTGHSHCSRLAKAIVIGRRCGDKLCGHQSAKTLRR